VFLLTHPFWLLEPRRWIWAAIAAALGLLAAAHAFETFGHMPPCELCLKQREVYWAAAAAGAAILLAAQVAPAYPLARLGCGLLALIFLGETGVAVYHAGVEWKFWPGPAACTGGPRVHITVADLQAFARGKTYEVVRCDQPAFRFIGLSMAGWNVLIALKLTGLSLWSALVRTPSETPA
jgi:disulfide bond formation protein DsbB